jgi:hypothetical protein
MTNKNYSLSEQEKQNVTVLSASGLTIHAIAVRLGRSDKVVKKHLTCPPVLMQVQNIRERLIVKYQQLAQDCLDKLLEPGTIDKASPRDLATISAISVDKARLLSDLSTNNLAIHNSEVVDLSLDRGAIRAALRELGRIPPLQTLQIEGRDEKGDSSEL